MLVMKSQVLKIVLYLGDFFVEFRIFGKKKFVNLIMFGYV